MCIISSIHITYMDIVSSHFLFVAGKWLFSRFLVYNIPTMKACYLRLAISQPKIEKCKKVSVFCFPHILKLKLTKCPN